MGGSVSTVNNLPMEDTNGNARSIEELSAVLMPIYFIEDPITSEEKDKAVRSWKMIASGQAAEFYRLKKADPANVPCSTPMEFFGNRFIQRFFEVHPIAAPMFSKTSMKQGTLFFRMISFTIAALDDDSKFDSQFVTLARSHNRMGIRAVEYGIFGECLFWVLKQTLGPEYDAVTHMGWVKIFSRVLKAMVPVAIEYEIENKATMKSRVTSRFQALTTTLDQQAQLKSKLNNLSTKSDDSMSSMSLQSLASMTVVTMAASTSS